MRTLIALTAVISVGGLSTAFAMDPPSASPTSSTATETGTAPTTTTATVAQPTDGKTATDNPAATTVKLVAGDADADKQLKRLKAAGYKAEMHGQQVVFCRREAQLGSRFERKVCNSADAIEQQMQQAQELTEKTQRMGVNESRGN